MAEPAEQESQMEDPLSEVELHTPFSSTIDAHSNTDLATLDNSAKQLLLEQDSLQLDFVEETQYVAIELDSQALSDPLSPPARLLQEDQAQPTPAPPPRESSPFLSRFDPPDLINAENPGFKFGKASKHQPGKYCRPLPRLASVEPTPVPIVLFKPPMVTQTPQAPPVSSHSREPQTSSQKTLSPTPTKNNHVHSLTHVLTLNEFPIPEQHASRHSVMGPPHADNIRVSNIAHKATDEETSTPEPHQSRNSTMHPLITDSLSASSCAHRPPWNTAQDLPILKAHENTAVSLNPLQQVPANTSNGRSMPRMSKKQRKRSVKRPIGEPSVTEPTQTPTQSHIKSAKVFQTPGESPTPLGPKLKARPFPEVYSDEQDFGRLPWALKPIDETANNLTSSASNDRRRRSSSTDSTRCPLQTQHGPNNSLALDFGLLANHSTHVKAHSPPVHNRESDHGKDKLFRRALDSEEHIAYSERVDDLENDRPKSPTVEAIQEQFRSGHDSNIILKAPSQVQCRDPQSSIFSSDDGVQLQSRGPSKAQSEHPPRPQSQRSNYGASMTRPLRQEQLNSEGGNDPAILHNYHATKVKRPNGGQNPSVSEKLNGELLAKRPQSETTISMIDKYKKFVTLGAEFEKTLEDYESQRAEVISQQIRIQELEDANRDFNEKTAGLEQEKVMLMGKISRFAELSSKYKHHMNDVVMTQKYLKSQAVTMRDTMDEAIKNAQKIRQNQGERLEYAIRAADKVFSEAPSKFSRVTAEADNILKEALASNKTLAIQVEAVTKTNKLQEATIDKHLLELSSEIHKSEGLKKQLRFTRTVHQEFADTLKQIPCNVASELIKDEGVISKILTSESITQAKVDQVTTLIIALKNNDSEPSSATIKLIEDLFTRLETNLPSKDDSEPQNSGIQLLEELKEHFNQVRLDHEAQGRLNSQIAELHESNAILSAEKNSWELEVQDVTKQVEALRRDLVDTRGQLTEKTEEITTLRALSKDNAELHAKIRDLESIKDLLQGHLDNAKQETSNVNREMAALKASSLGKDEQIKQLQHKFTDAQTKIKNFNDDKIKYQEMCKLDAEMAKQELAKSANASRATMTKKYQSQIQNLEQKREEAEAELSTVKEEIQRLQDKEAASSGQANTLRAELTQCKEYINQQDPQLERLEQENPGREIFERHSADLLSVRREVAASQSRIQSLQNDLAQHKESAVKLLKEIEGNLPLVDTLQCDKDMLEEKNAKLQKQIDALAEARKKQQLAESEKPDGYASTLNISCGKNGRLDPPVRTISRNSLQTTKEIFGTDFIGSVAQFDEPISVLQLHTGTSPVTIPPVFKGKGYGNPPHAGNHSTLEFGTQIDHDIPASHQRRPAQRKPSKMSLLNLSENEGPTTQTDGVAQDSTHQDPHLIEGLPTKTHASIFVTPVVKPFSHMPSIITSSGSSLSDLSQMFEQVQSTDNHRVEVDLPTPKFQQGIGKNDSAFATTTSVSRNVDAQIAINRKGTSKKLEALSTHQHSYEKGSMRVKANLNAPSTIEESNRRRQESKLKSAIKNMDASSSKLTNADIQSCSSNSTTSNQPAPLLSNRSQRSNAPNRLSMKYGKTTLSQSVKMTGAGLFSNSVSGDGGRSNTNLNAAAQSASPAKAHGSAPETLIRQPRRNPSSLKRVADSVPGLHMAKVPRTARGRLSTRHVTPDSQETSQQS